MAEYRLSEKAIIDLSEIADYTIENFGIKQSRRYRDGLIETFKSLAHDPNIGRKAFEFAMGLMRYRYASHVIFYIPYDTEIFIVRVLGERMDFIRHL